jgi:hypothetical protein
MTKPSRNPICVSIGILAWNEEESLQTTLESLFRQSVFQKLSARRERAEIWCVANGCTDRTVAVAREFFARMEQKHEYADAFVAHVVDVPEPGKCNAWNRFVHEFSAPEARFLCLMDADIVFHHLDSIYNLVVALERRPDVAVSTGRPCKDILFKERKTFWDRISLATSDMTATGKGQMCGQLYCVPAELARNLRLPRGLGVEDGFIKEVLCTHFLTRPSDPNRVITVPDVAHIFEAYVAPGAVLNNQKRQMISQATVHVLFSHLRKLPPDDRRNFAESIRRLEAQNAEWVKTLVFEHVRAAPYFWQLFPGLLTFRFRRLLKLPGLRKLTHAPAAVIGFGVTTIAAWRAHRSLRKGMTEYWPKATRQSILTVPSVGAK